MHKRMGNQFGRTMLRNQKAYAFLNTIFTMVELIWTNVVTFRKMKEASLVKIPRSPQPNESDATRLLRYYAVELDYWLIVSAVFSLLYCIIDLVLALVLLHNVTNKKNHRHYLIWLVVAQGTLVFLMIVDLIMYLAIFKATTTQKVSFMFLGLYLVWKISLLIQYHIKAKRSPPPTSPQPETMEALTSTTIAPPINNQSQFLQPPPITSSSERETEPVNQVAVPIMRETSESEKDKNDLMNFDSKAPETESKTRNSEQTEENERTIIITGEVQ